ncbi:putative membrane protein (TIGR01666 family) [Kushneria sinocarnis]|uniref:Putative membrane protein (TIGR01666 family) n=1 Tax=Kushneria sinocarnis TaxID=595502 RepID=A0A420WW71_9GAMM|nr:YccS family putative transporter [Kushneria sinocarnis]RKR03389.1 putative membrane protein (TIGR01666 family) [Kushneria sinocarnis]
MSSSEFPAALSLSLRRLWALDRFAYSFRVFIALSGAMLWSWWQDDMQVMIPLFLGIIASALAETDDSWQGRLLALLVTLVCFSVAALSVELLFEWPWLFAVSLGASSFMLIMLGAIGQRYATIASATLILSVYTMISLEHRGGVPPDNLWHGPALLVSGAAWYGLLSVLWHALFTHQPVRQSLATLLSELGDYLRLKSALFEPIRGVDIEQRRVALLRQNGRVVEALNQTKEMIFSRIDGQRSGRRLDRYLRLYFIAQDIHERASSTHYPYGALIEHFYHSDVLFRCQRLLHQQGRACQTLSRALLLRRAFDHHESEQALEDLRASLDHLHAHGQPDTPERQRLLRSLNALLINLTALERQLGGAYNPEVIPAEGDRSLFDRTPSGPRDAWQRVRGHLRLRSPILRHALRLSTALMVGYGVLRLVHPVQGYWILLTTLFVCRPSFGATHRFLRQRILGTVGGLVAGWALITLFPQPLVQSMIAVLAGVLFFANRTTRYTLATAAITLMVLCCFNQVGNGFGLILPRLIDTLLGALIAGLAVVLILPDWQGRRLNREAAATVSASRDYLREIRRQYQTGKRDDLAYRLARRNAHNADAAFSTLLSNMLLEPAPYRRGADDGFRFLVIAHTILGHLSALGAHRRNLQRHEADHPDDPAVAYAYEQLIGYLDRIARALSERTAIAPFEPAPEAVAASLEPQPETSDEGDRLVPTQLALICRQITPLAEAAGRLTDSGTGTTRATAVSGQAGRSG